MKVFLTDSHHKPANIVAFNWLLILVNESLPFTVISIYVVRSKLQGYGTRPKGGMGRLELILGFRGCRREMDMEAENTISIALRVLTKSNKNRYDS